MKGRKIAQLAAVGSTGANTHASAATDSDFDSLSLEFEITAVGATPTITYKYQGSQDDPTVADASSDWFDLEVLPNDAATEAVSATKTAVGVYESTVDLGRRPFNKIRLVTSANTNVTYESEAFGFVDV